MVSSFPTWWGSDTHSRWTSSRGPGHHVLRYRHPEMTKTTLADGAVAARLRSIAVEGARHAQAVLLRQRITGVLRQEPHSGSLRLHLGCGAVHLPGWCNIDNDRGPAVDVRWDLRNGLPLPLGIASRIYSEHFFEHMELDEGLQLFRDCRRVLSDNGVFRVAMPDLARVIDNYRGGWRDVPVLQEPNFSFIDTNAHYVNYVMRAWGHRYLYDFDDLSKRLRDAGFRDVVRCQSGMSPHADLCGLETRAESLLILEASP